MTDMSHLNTFTAWGLCGSGGEGNRVRNEGEPAQANPSVGACLNELYGRLVESGFAHARCCPVARRVTKTLRILTLYVYLEPHSDHYDAYACHPLCLTMLWGAVAQRQFLLAPRSAWESALTS